MNDRSQAHSDASVDDIDLRVNVHRGVDVESIAETLRSAGLTVDHTSRRGGVVFVRSPRSKMWDINNLDGVSSVAEAGSITLPPFDAGFPQ